MNKTYRLKKGQIVKSKAGRDEGRVFVILEIVDDEFVKIANGKIRTIEKPKKKRVKHLMIYNEYIDLEVQHFNDSYLRKSLKKFEN